MYGRKHCAVDASNHIIGEIDKRVERFWHCRNSGHDGSCLGEAQTLPVERPGQTVDSE
jgi:hypothetical protein